MKWKGWKDNSEEWVPNRDINNVIIFGSSVTSQRYFITDCKYLF